MKHISEIDKNFRVNSTINRQNIQLYNVQEEPFQIYGLMYEEGKFCRIPGEVARRVNDGVWRLYANTSGGRVRFVTNSSYVAISASMEAIGKMSHFPLTGSAGFDLYVDEGKGQQYQGTFSPPYDIENGYEGVIDFSDARERIITIHFPLYSNVTDLHIGLEQKAMVKQAPAYRCEKPIVFYGSSITQGGCASRPGNSYSAILSRLLDYNFINLGFSGNARGEDAITDYINSLDMSIFVLDYDHNAPTVEHLRDTHCRMYQRIRKCHPDLPIILMTRPKVHLSEDEIQRVIVIEDTYQSAVQAGDRNIYLLKGTDLIGERIIETATVDGTHPNDSGFVSMAYALYELLLNSCI